MQTLKIAVPSGIGDISWIYSKFSLLKDIDLEFYICGDGHKRALPYVEMLPKIKKVVYTDMTFKEMRGCPQPTFKEMLKRDDIIMLEANTHLENGNRIEQFLPDLPTDFYYKLNVRKTKIFDPGKKIVGIFMANQNTSIVWNGWTPEEWMLFIKIIKEVYPSAQFVLIGASWDKSMRDTLLPYLDINNIDYVDYVDKTTFPEALSIIEELDLFISFASGLSVLSLNVRTPVLMLYPDVLKKMMYSWVAPDAMTNDSYYASLWERPTILAKNARTFIIKAIEKNRRKDETNAYFVR